MLHYGNAEPRESPVTLFIWSIAGLHCVLELGHKLCVSVCVCECVDAFVCIVYVAGPKAGWQWCGVVV